jgi:hypothetical protein
MTLSNVLRIKNRFRLSMHLTKTLGSGSLLKSWILGYIRHSLSGLPGVIITQDVVMFSQVKHFLLY